VRRIEHQHNTPEQVHHYLEQALVIVADLELADELKVPAFEKAVDLIAGKQIVFEQIAPAGLDLSSIKHG
jgi:hypothetical protein